MKRLTPGSGMIAMLITLASPAVLPQFVPQFQGETDLNAKEEQLKALLLHP